jgi:hypothetical protein
MSFIPTIPDPAKIKQTLAKAHRNCQEMELAGIQLEEVIAKLESHDWEATPTRNIDSAQTKIGKSIRTRVDLVFWMWYSID